MNRPDLAEAVGDELRTCRDVKSRQRLVAAGGQLTAKQIAEQLGIFRRRFFDWMNALKAGGLVGLLERQHGGGAVLQVQGDARKELVAALQAGQWKRAKEIQHCVPAQALRTVGELERGWWKTGAPVGGHRVRPRD